MTIAPPTTPQGAERFCTRALPCHLRPRREKVFGDGRPRAMDRNAKVRVMTLARALSRRTEKGKHYGAITAKALAVLEALLWTFHNARSGLCFPSYEKIAEAAGCARSTVAEAIKALEDAGLLTWVNRLVRVRVAAPDLFGRNGWQWKVIRTSNGYAFRDPNPAASKDLVSKSDLPAVTATQESLSSPTPRVLDLTNPIDAALHRLGRCIGAVS